MTRLVALFAFVVVTAFCFASTSSPPPASNPQAAAYAAQSIAAMTGGATISDVTLTGNVTWNSSDTGTATLRALGTGESRMDLALSSGTRTEIRDAQTGVMLGQWFSPTSASGRFALQNCYTDAVWFFSPLGSLASGANTVFSYIGQDNLNGVAVQHIQSYVYQPAQAVNSISQQLTTMDFYLDATTFLPVAVMFNVHPDNDATTNILIEVDFSNYQTLSGLTIPMHVQRHQQGNPVIDIVLSSASINTGLPLSLFTIN